MWSWPLEVLKKAWRKGKGRRWRRFFDSYSDDDSSFDGGDAGEIRVILENLELSTKEDEDVTLTERLVTYIAILLRYYFSIGKKK